jgi:pimeloyl-ACP methyl ester carboxylesterase
MKEYFLKYKEFNVCIYEIGTGEIPIVLIHGAGIDSALLSWQEVLSLISDKFKVYAIDLLGYGKSDKPKNIAGHRFYETHIECLESIITQLDLDSLVLSGLSMGGAISIGYTLKNPNKIKALIPIDSWGLVSKMPFHLFYYWYFNTSFASKSFQWLGKYKWLLKWSIQYSLIGDKSRVSQELVDTLFSLCKDPNCEKSMLDFQRSSITKDNVVPNFTNNLSEIFIPVLFVNGDKDSLVSPKTAFKASKSVRNGQIHIMSGCKHWAQKERPEEFVETIEKFIFSL